MDSSVNLSAAHDLFIFACFDTQPHTCSHLWSLLMKSGQWLLVATSLPIPISVHFYHRTCSGTCLLVNCTTCSFIHTSGSAASGGSLRSGSQSTSGNLNLRGWLKQASKNSEEKIYTTRKQ